MSGRRARGCAPVSWPRFAGKALLVWLVPTAVVVSAITAHEESAGNAAPLYRTDPQPTGEPAEEPTPFPKSP